MVIDVLVLFTINSLIQIKIEEVQKLTGGFRDSHNFGTFF